MIPSAERRFEEALLRFRQADYLAAMRIWQSLLDEGHAHPNLELFLHAAQAEQKRILELVEDFSSRIDGALPALEECRRIVEEHPDYADWQYRRAILASSLGLAREALEALEEALSVNPQFALAWHHKGILLRHAGDLQGACDSLRQAAAHRADSDPAAKLEAERLERSGSLEAAARAWFSAVKMAPDYASRHIETGKALYWDAKPEEAEREIARGLSLAPHYPDGHYYLGLIALGQGRAPEAIAHLRTALSHSPQYVDAALKLVEAYLAGGNLAAARDTLEQWRETAASDERHGGAFRKLERRARDEKLEKAEPKKIRPRASPEGRTARAGKPRKPSRRRAASGS